MRLSMRGISIETFLALAPLMLAGTLVIAVRAALGFQFPVPWPDETGFISPAFNLAHTGSLFDAGMNPDRIVMWMPPGYMVALAASFKVFGYSFALVRWLSAAAILGAIGLAAAVLMHMAHGVRRVLGGVVIGVAFVSPYVLIIGNIGRMEALFCFLILAALLAGVRERFYVMGALVCMAALVHFNAVYFVPAAAIPLATRLASGRLGWPGRGGWIAISACALGVLGYGVFIAAQWRGFLDDMRFQFAFKAAFGYADPAHPAWLVWIAVALLIALGVYRRRADAALLTGLVGVGFIAMAHGGHEIWYDYGQPLGFALLTLAWLDSAPQATGAAWYPAPAAMAGIMTLVLASRITPVMAALLPEPAMLTRDYVPAGDIARLRHFAATLHPGDTVDFGWTGMANFFLAELAQSGARWTIIRHSVTAAKPFRASTWRVACDSKEVPRFLLQFDISIHRDGADTGCRVLPGLHP